MSSNRSYGSSLINYVLVFVFVAIIIIAILTLLGPAIGNVHSNIVANLPSQGFNGQQTAGDNSSPRPSPTQVSAATWDDEMTSVRPGDRLVIKNGDIWLIVEDTHRAINQVMQVASAHGGYVVSSRITGEGERAEADLTITVRAEEFETAFDQLRRAAIEVAGESATGDDVSDEYVDLQSRLRNLEATRDRLRDFLEKANTVNEALKVNEELASIEAEIEQVKGRMTYLGERAALSTITVHLSMPVPAAPTPTPTPTPAPWQIQPTIKNSLDVQANLMRSLAEGIVWLLIVAGPYVLLLGVAAFGIRAWFQRTSG